MNWFPTDLPSFLWGIMIGLGGAFLTGILQEAGKDTWLWLKRKVSSVPLIKLDGKFIPTLYDPGSCAWVPEERVYDYEQKGYTYYSKGNAKCFREA
jgi:hypothetical protein